MPQNKYCNKKIGNSFELDFCEILSNFGFWVHNMAQNHAGQPADVIAVRNHHAHLIDCKVCSGKGFPLRRIEENQELSMKLWHECGNGAGWFAILIDDEIYMVSKNAMDAAKAEGISALSKNKIDQLGLPLGVWLNLCS